MKHKFELGLFIGLLIGLFFGCGFFTRLMTNEPPKQQTDYNPLTVGKIGPQEVKTLDYGDDYSTYQDY